MKTTKTARSRLFRSLYPRERWTPAEWAENCRVLSEEESSEPGPYTFDRTPYWRFVLDLIADPNIEEIVCLKGAQIGWSELCRNALGYWVDLDPGPTLVLMPDQKSAEDFRDERIGPLIKYTEAVSRHVSSRAWDSTKHRIKFDTMSVFFAWAGSKTGTKSRPIRNLLCEEPDEYPAFSSSGGDPLSKAEKRLTTYRDKGRSKSLIGGTPTTRRGNVYKRWGMCGIRYHYWVPCPRCNGFQQLLWKQVKWPKFPNMERAARAEKVKAEALAYYECEHCKQAILDHQKPRMLRLGVWAGEDQAVTIDGRVVGHLPKAKRVGVKISGLYSPWVRFSELAAEQIESKGDQNAQCDFINQRLAEPWEEERATTDPDIIRQKSQVMDGSGVWTASPNAPAPLIVPAWANHLIATADTQGNNEQDGYFYYVIRAWGYSYRSQLIDYGVCSTKEELKERCLDRQLSMEPNGALVVPQLLVIDSGGPRWQEIYQFGQTDPRIHPAKGESVVRDFMVTEKPQKAHGIVLWKIDTEQSKDLLHQLIHDPDQTKWMVHGEITDDYCRQMASESKVFDPQSGREAWVEIVKKNNHFWDCEHMNAAVAWRRAAGVPAPPEVKQEPRSEESYNPVTSYRGRW